jgi:hypothetical protein
MNRIVIIIEGGLVQQVLSDGEPVTVAVVDYDVEGADLDDLTKLDGEDAFISHWTADNSDPAFVDRAFAAPPTWA